MNLELKFEDAASRVSVQFRSRNKKGCFDKERRKINININININIIVNISVVSPYMQCKWAVAVRTPGGGLAYRV